jgi:hypothetical protein
VNARHTRLVGPALAGVLLLCACAKEPPSTGKRPEGLSDQQLAALDAKRSAHEKELKAMNVENLVRELAAESRKGVEPFNSAAWREAVSRGAAIGPELQKLIAAGAPEPTQLLAIVALHSVSVEDYRQLDPALRATVLADSLRDSKMFNTWGIPHLFWEEPARMIIEEGAAIEPQLRKLLQDQRPAPAWGSEGASTQKEFQYRVCDYAWALLNEIKGVKNEIPPDPKQRDAAMQLLLQPAPAGTPK